MNPKNLTQILSQSTSDLTQTSLIILTLTSARKDLSGAGVQSRQRRHQETASVGVLRLTVASSSSSSLRKTPSRQTMSPEPLLSIRQGIRARLRIKFSSLFYCLNFSRVNATLQPAKSVGQMVGRTVIRYFFVISGIFRITAPAQI